jgi:hypothetical protein
MDGSISLSRSTVGAQDAASSIARQISVGERAARAQQDPSLAFAMPASWRTQSFV